jgi:hypothetical protein
LHRLQKRSRSKIDQWHQYDMTRDNYTFALAAKFCAAIVDGSSLRSVCKKKDMPSKATVFRWQR